MIGGGRQLFICILYIATYVAYVEGHVRPEPSKDELPSLGCTKIGTFTVLITAHSVEYFYILC